MAQKKSLISENEETIYSVKLGFQILERWGGYGSKTDPFRVPSFKIQKKKKNHQFWLNSLFSEPSAFSKKKGENESLRSISRPWGALWLDLKLSRTVSREPFCHFQIHTDRKGRWRYTTKEKLSM